MSKSFLPLIDCNLSFTVVLQKCLIRLWSTWIRHRVNMLFWSWVLSWFRFGSMCLKWAGYEVPECESFEYQLPRYIHFELVSPEASIMNYEGTEYSGPVLCAARTTPNLLFVRLSNLLLYKLKLKYSLSHIPEIGRVIVMGSRQIPMQFLSLVITLVPSRVGCIKLFGSQFENHLAWSALDRWEKWQIKLRPYCTI